MSINSLAAQNTSMYASSVFQGPQLEKADVRQELSDIHLIARQETYLCVPANLRKQVLGLLHRGFVATRRM